MGPKADFSRSGLSRTNAMCYTLGILPQWMDCRKDTELAKRFAKLQRQAQRNEGLRDCKTVQIFLKRCSSRWRGREMPAAILGHLDCNSAVPGGVSAKLSKRRTDRGWREQGARSLHRGVRVGHWPPPMERCALPWGFCLCLPVCRGIFQSV